MSTASRVGELLQYGSLRKRIFVTPDLYDEVATYVSGLERVTVEVPQHWSNGLGVMVAWDEEMERPDVA